jgi:hypothetical protein
MEINRSQLHYSSEMYLHLLLVFKLGLKQLVKLKTMVLFIKKSRSSRNVQRRFSRRLMERDTLQHIKQSVAAGQKGRRTPPHFASLYDRVMAGQLYRKDAKAAMQLLLDNLGERGLVVLGGRLTTRFMKECVHNAHTQLIYMFSDDSITTAQGSERFTAPMAVLRDFTELLDSIKCME